MGKAITEISAYAGPISGTTKVPVSDSDTLQAGTASQVLAYIVANLGGAATKDVGTTAGTVAAGDDARMTNERAPTEAGLATKLHGATAKNTLVDGDEVNGTDSAASWGLIRTTWGNVKAFLKTYFDTLYQAASANLSAWAALATSAKQDTLVSGTNIKTINGSEVLGSGNLSVSASPAGAATQVQFNDDGSALGGDSGLTFNKTTKALSVGGATVTTDNPVANLTQTWNASGVTFNGIKLNITNTASAAASKLIDLQVGGTSQFNLRKDGVLYFPTWEPVPGLNGFGLKYSTGGYANGIGPSGVGLWVLGVTSGSGFEFASMCRLAWHNTTVSTASANIDTGFARDAAGVMKVTDGGATNLRDLKLRNLIGTGNLATGTAAKSAGYTATTSDGTIEVDASGAASTITLFAASGNAGKILVIKKTDSSANAVTIDGNASETIDGATTISLASQYSTAIIQVNAAGTGWNKLAGI